MLSNSSSSSDGDGSGDDEHHRNGDAVENALIVTNEHNIDVDTGDDGADEEEEDSQNEEEESSSSSQPLIQVQQVLPQAREHSYLPGASHPLYSVSSSAPLLFDSHHDNENNDDDTTNEAAARRRHGNNDTTENNGGGAGDESLSSSSSWPLHHQRHNASSSTTSARIKKIKGEGIELCILELQGVVLFPGSTLPIRLQQREWIDHLGRLIDQSRTSPGLYPTVQLGILTAQPDSDDEDDDDDNQHGVDGQQRRQSGHHQRVSWTRRALGPARLRRLSQQLIQELGDLDDLLAQDDEDHDHSANAAAGAADANNNNDNGMSDNDNDETTAFTDIPRVNSDFFRDSQASHHHHDGTGDSVPPRSLDRYAGRIGTIATITCTYDDAADDTDNALDHSDNINSREASTTRGSTNPVWQMHHRQHDRPLVVTAIGTGRFRVLTSSSDEAAAVMAQQQQQANNPSLTGFARHAAAAASRRSIGGVKTMLVEELDDTPLSWPAPWLARLSPSCGLSASVTVSNSSNHDEPPPPVGDDIKNAVTTMYDINNYSNHRMIHSLSCISPIPAFVYKSVWPWQLVDDIQQRLERLPTMTGLVQALAHNNENDNDDNNNPTRFSFWLSANLALKWEERLRLLEMRSTVERLRCLQGRIQQEERAESILHCRECRNPLSRSSQMFGVGGAEGTTGAYVNEYGCIHQTITIRSLNLQQNNHHNNHHHHDADAARQAEEQHVLLTGGPQIKDSWFPGYAWTIMSCAFCASHLGWKFQRVLSPPQPGHRLRVATGNTTTTTTTTTTADDSDTTNNRPDVFYGLSAASVVIYVPQPPPPGASRQTRLFWQQRLRRSSRETAI